MCGLLIIGIKTEEILSKKRSKWIRVGEQGRNQEGKPRKPPEGEGGGRGQEGKTRELGALAHKLGRSPSWGCGVLLGVRVGIKGWAAASLKVAPWHHYIAPPSGEHTSPFFERNSLSVIEAVLSIIDPSIHWPIHLLQIHSVIH